MRVGTRLVEARGLCESGTLQWSLSIQVGASSRSTGGMGLWAAVGFVVVDHVAISLNN